MMLDYMDDTTALACLSSCQALHAGYPPVPSEARHIGRHLPEGNSAEGVPRSPATCVALLANVSCLSSGDRHFVGTERSNLDRPPPFLGCCTSRLLLQSGVDGDQTEKGLLYQREVGTVEETVT